MRFVHLGFPFSYRKNKMIFQCDCPFFPLWKVLDLILAIQSLSRQVPLNAFLGIMKGTQGGIKQKQWKYWSKPWWNSRTWLVITSPIWALIGQWCVMLVLGLCIGQLKGQLTRHACVGGQNASCARAVVPHFAESTVFFLWRRTTDV